MDPGLLRQTSGFDYIFGWGWALALGLLILLWPIPRADKIPLLWIWVIKSVVALGIMLVYEDHYVLDAYFYFLSGHISPTALSDVHIGNGTEVMLFLSSIHSLALPISYHAEKVTCAYLGLVGVYQFYVAARVHWTKLDTRALYVLALYPSILFWTTILGKDPIVLMGIGFFVRGVVTWYDEDRVSPLFLSALGVLICAIVRAWLAPILVMPLAIFLLVRINRVWARVFFAVALFGAVVGSSRYFLQGINAESATDLLDVSNQVAHSWQAGGSGQELTTEFNSFGAILSFMPIGIFTALFRPLPGELFTPFAFIASLENGVLFYLFIRALRRLRSSDFRDPVIVWLAVFIFFWSAVYGIACYQNLGTSVRFRLQVLPVFFGLLLYLGRRPGEVWSADDTREDEEEDELDDQDIDDGDSLAMPSVSRSR